MKPSTKIMLATSAGTVFEWYDFFIYSSLAIFFSKVFFPVGNDVASFLIVLATLGVGLLVRPLGAMIFGRLGDLIGRKKVFMTTIVLMGISTCLIGTVPGFAAIGWAAPIIIVILRILQGLALGGEYGGAVTYITEHTEKANRGFYSSFVQSTVVVGFILTFAVVLAVKTLVPAEQFADWGWRIPFLLSSLFLVISVVVRSTLVESPEFEKIYKANETSTRPLTEVFTQPENRKWFLILLGMLAGQGVVSYITQVYVIFFLTKVLNINVDVAFQMIIISLFASAAMIVTVGWLSDKVGRLKLIVLGLVLTTLTVMPLYQGLVHYANPALEKAQKEVNVVLSSSSNCSFNMLTAQTNECAKFKEFFSKNGVIYTFVPTGDATTVTVNNIATSYNKFDQVVLSKSLTDANFPMKAKLEDINKPMVITILVILLFYMALCYAPIGALMSEMFPTRVRFSAISTVSAVGNGWFGGMLPLIVSTMIAYSGDIYFGLWYPIIVTGISSIVCIIFYNQLLEKTS